MDTILLGEAPKNPNGFAFDWKSWSTKQIADVVGVDPFHLNKIFWLEDVFSERQPTTGRGFDHFPLDDAVEQLRKIRFKYQRIICVGTRVMRVVEVMLDLPHYAIPENRFKRFDRTARGNGWWLARIPHPSSLRGQEDADGLVLPHLTRRFLRQAAGR